MCGREAGGSERAARTSSRYLSSSKSTRVREDQRRHCSCNSTNEPHPGSTPTNIPQGQLFSWYMRTPTDASFSHEVMLIKLCMVFSGVVLPHTFKTYSKVYT